MTTVVIPVARRANLSTAVHMPYIVRYGFYGE